MHPHLCAAVTKVSVIAIHEFSHFDNAAIYYTYLDMYIIANPLGVFEDFQKIKKLGIRKIEVMVVQGRKLFDLVCGFCLFVCFQ